MLRRRKGLHERLLDDAAVRETAAALEEAALADPTAQVRASDETAAFIRKRGGRLYIWVTGPGLKHVKTKPPRRAVEFERHPAKGFDLFQDVEIETPRVWLVAHRRFPSRLEAFWDGHENAVEASSGP